MGTRELQNYAWGPDRRARENYHFMARGRNSHECTRVRAYIGVRVTRARRPRRRYRYATKPSCKIHLVNKVYKSGIGEQVQSRRAQILML